MSDWKTKRFWKQATVSAVSDGFEVLLDSRPVKTPAKAPLIVPTEAMASAIAAEWDAQVEEIDPLSMPVTRGANAAIDKVAVQQDEVVALIAAYGDSDLLCYRAAGPEELVARQAERWNPLLIWSEEALGARLDVAEGVMHIAQPTASLESLTAKVAELDNFALAGFHDLVSISGSLVLGLAVIADRLSADEAWQLSRLDEDWQIEQWGEDDEATELVAKKQMAFVSAAIFYKMSLT